MKGLTNRKGQAATEYVVMLALLTGIGLWLAFALGGSNGAISSARDAAVDKIPND